MNTYEAISKMKEAAESAALPFAELGLGTGVEVFCYDSRLRPADEEHAAYVSAVLTVTLTDEDGKTHEYNINAGCEAKRGSVSEEELKGAILSFEEECRAVRDRLTSEDAAAVLDELDAVSVEEYERLIKKLKRMQTISLVLGIIAVAVVIAFALM